MEYYLLALSIFLLAGGLYLALFPNKNVEPVRGFYGSFSMLYHQLKGDVQEYLNKPSKKSELWFIRLAGILLIISGLFGIAFAITPIETSIAFFRSLSAQ